MMKGSTIITTQVRPPGLIDLFEDRVMAEAIVDRLTANAQYNRIKEWE